LSSSIIHLTDGEKVDFDKPYDFRAEGNPFANNSYFKIISKDMVMTYEYNNFPTISLVKNQTLDLSSSQANSIEYGIDPFDDTGNYLLGSIFTQTQSRYNIQHFNWRYCIRNTCISGRANVVYEFKIIASPW